MHHNPATRPRGFVLGQEEDLLAAASGHMAGSVGTHGASASASAGTYVPSEERLKEMKKNSPIIMRTVIHAIGSRSDHDGSDM